MLLLSSVNSTFLKPARTKSFNYIFVAIAFKSFWLCSFNKHSLVAQDMLGSVKDAAFAFRLQRRIQAADAPISAGEIQRWRPVLCVLCMSSQEMHLTYLSSSQGRHPGGSKCLFWQSKRSESSKPKRRAFQHRSMAVTQSVAHSGKQRLINTAEWQTKRLEKYTRWLEYRVQFLNLHSTEFILNTKVLGVAHNRVLVYF